VTWLAAQRTVLESMIDGLSIVGSLGTARLPLFEGLAVDELDLDGEALAGVALGMAEAGRSVLLELGDPSLLPALSARLSLELPGLIAAKGSVPLTVRAWSGAGTGGGPLLSLPSEDLVPAVPGLSLVVPSCIDTAAGLLRGALEAASPVVIIEPLRLRETAARGEADPGQARHPIGTAHRLRPGRDVTLLCWGAMVDEALAAATEVAAQGIEAEVLELRTLWPLDEAMIGESVRRTGRALVAADGGGAVCQRVQTTVITEGFWRLEAPVRTVCGPWPGLSAEVPDRQVVARALADLIQE
jgi:pyruvate/2-oxoglutarate/acetoin dehydrogenase E1 component